MFVENAESETRETRALSIIVARARTPSLSFYPRLTFAPAEVGARSGETPIRLTPFVAFRDGVAVQSRAARKKVVERWQMRLILEILNNSLSTAIHFHSRCVTFSNARCHCAAFLTASCLLAPTSQVYRHENLTRVYAHALYLAVLTYSHG